MISISMMRSWGPCPLSLVSRYREIEKETRTHTYILPLSLSHFYTHTHTHTLTHTVGDLNGSPKGQVAQYLKHKGFVSAFDAHNRPRAPAKVDQWISHFSHRKEFVGVDYIWHLQPQNQSLPLAADWRKLVFSEIQKELPSAMRAAFKVGRFCVCVCV